MHAAATPGVPGMTEGAPRGGGSAESHSSLDPSVRTSFVHVYKDCAKTTAIELSIFCSMHAQNLFPIASCMQLARSAHGRGL